MRVTFRQSGGFAGLVRGCRIDAAALGPAERRELERLVAASDLCGERADFGDEGRDLRHYELVIERGADVARLACDERRLPASVRPLVAFLAARSGPGTAPGAWGRFEGRVVARWDGDGRSMTLVEPFAYVDPAELRWPAPAGSVVNGASIPRPFWSLIGAPFSGPYREASVVHDVACVERDRSWQAVHRMFHDACRCGGVSAGQATLLYYAVYHFGPRWRLEPRPGALPGVPPAAVAEPVPEATPADVAAADRYFATHEVAPDDVPVLSIPPLAP